MRKFHIYQNWYGNEKLYEKEIISIRDGVTVLVGCNGAGKTTLIHQIKSRLDEKKIHYIPFDNLRDGGNHAMQNACDLGKISFLATAALSSEDENIVMNLGEFAAKIKKEIGITKIAGLKELWIFLDATDSGLSIDNIVYLKLLFGLIKKDCIERGITAYILASANEYELPRGEQCFDVIRGEYITFSDYEDYRNFILKTAEKKEKRQNVL